MHRIEYFSMLSIKNLTKTYEDAAVVDDVTIDLPPGKVISLIGPNGAGKSTVLGMISRLIARTAGIVEFKGRDITHWESRELAKHLAILTQANFVQMKLTVRELVAFGRFPHSGSALSADDWTKVDQAIHYMELEAFADRFIDEMSGGQRQRAFIAMVLAQDTARRTHQQSRHLSRHADDEARPAPLRRIGQDRDSGASRNQSRGVLFRRDLRFQGWPDRRTGNR